MLQAPLRGPLRGPRLAARVWQSRPAVAGHLQVDKWLCFGGKTGRLPRHLLYGYRDFSHAPPQHAVRRRAYGRERRRRRGRTGIGRGHRRLRGTQAVPGNANALGGARPEESREGGRGRDGRAGLGRIGSRGGLFPRPSGAGAGGRGLFGGLRYGRRGLCDRSTEEEEVSFAEKSLPNFLELYCSCSTGRS